MIQKNHTIQTELVYLHNKKILNNSSRFNEKKGKPQNITSYNRQYANRTKQHNKKKQKLTIKDPHLIYRTFEIDRTAFESENSQEKAESECNGDRRAGVAIAHVRLARRTFSGRTVMAVSSFSLSRGVHRQRVGRCRWRAAGGLDSPFRKRRRL